MNKTQRGKNRNKNFVTVLGASELLNVSIDTIRRWEKKGKLKAERLDGKNRYFAIDQLESFLSQKPLSTSEVAKLLGVSASTVRRLDQQGELSTYRDNNGKRHYNQKEIDQYIAKNNDLKSKASMQAAVSSSASATTLKIKRASGHPSKNPDTRHAARNVTSVDRSTYSDKLRKLFVHTITACVLVVAVFMLLFLTFPKQSAHFLAYDAPVLIDQNGKLYQPKNWSARALSPFGNLALSLVDVVDPSVRSQIQPAGITSISGLFSVDEQGDIKTNYIFSPQSSSFLQIPDQGLVYNLNSEFVGGYKPGQSDGNLAILPIGGDQIKDGSITIDQISPELLAQLKSTIISRETTEIRYVGASSSQQASAVAEIGDIEAVIAGIGLIGGANSGQATLNIQTGSSTQITGNSVEVRVAGSGSSASTTSVSGLEVTSQGLRLLGGCAGGEVLKWNGSSWACASDTSGGSLSVQENDTAISSSAITLDYLGSDFSVSESPVGEANISIDYSNSGITRDNTTEVITGNWSFNDNSFALQDENDGTKRAVFETSGVGAGTTRTFTLPNVNGNLITSGNLSSITSVGTVSSGTWQGGVIGAQYGGTGVNGSAATNGQILIGNGSGYSLAALTQGSGINITNGAGSISIDSTLGTSIDGSEIDSNAVALGTQTTGSYIATIGTLTGLSTTGNSGEGSTPTLSVLYGSSASTAVQGNTSITCASGSGNLTGGGNTITLGSGGTCSAISTNNAVSFSTSVTTPLLTNSGALTVETTGAGNDINLNGFDQVIVNAGSTVELQDNTNVTGNVDVSGTLASGTADAFQVATNGNVTSGTVNGQTISSLASFTGTLAAAGLITANGGITVEAGDTLTFNSEAFTDLTGTGLQISSGALQTTLGTSIQNSEVDDDLTISSSGSVDWTALTNYPSACAAGSAVSTIADSPSCTAFNTDTSITLQDAYTQGGSITTTDAIGDLTINLADTTTDRNLAINVSDNSSGSVLVTRANGSGTADPAQLILLDNLDIDRSIGVAIKVQSSAGGISTGVDLSDAEIVTAISIGANDILTAGSTIASTELDVLDGGISESEVSGEVESVAAGSGLTGGGTDGALTINIGAGNGIAVNADDVAVDSATTGTTATTSSNSGIEATSSGIRLLGGCSGNQVLRWNNGSSVWECANNDLDAAYAIDADKTFTVNDSAGLIVDLTSTGDFVFKDGGVAFATFDDTGGLLFAPNSSSDITFTLDNDSTFTSSGTVTGSGQLHNVDVTLGNDADVDVVSGLRIGATSATTGDLDELYGLHVDTLASASAVLEYAIKVGNNWDRIISSSNFWVTGGGDVISKGPDMDVRAFGATCNGSGDDTAAIQAAIDAAEVSGGVVRFPIGDCRITSTLTVDSSSVMLKGSGSFANTDVGSTTTKGTTLSWATGAGGPILKFTAIIGASNQAIKRVGITDMNFECAGYANIGLQLVSIQYSVFHDLYFRNCTDAAVDMNTVAGALGEATDTTRNDFANINIRQLDGSGASGIGIRLDGSASSSPLGNTALNTFTNIQVLHSNGIGVKFLNSDSNRFTGLTLNRSGSGIGIELNGSNSSLSYTARANVFYHLEPGQGGLTARGTGLTYKSRDNIAYDYTFENNLILPVIETGAGFNYFADRYFQTYIPSFNFGSVYTAGAFITNNSYYGQEFGADTHATAITADNAAIGDDGKWYFDTTSTTVSYSAGDNIGGHNRLTFGTTSGVGGMMGFGEAQNNLALVFAKSNLPILQMKLRTNVVNTTNDVVWGFMNQATAPTANDTLPAEGIFFWHGNSNTWTGYVRSGGANVGTVSCSGGTISTSQFATGRIEVISSSSVRFSMDYDASDGVNPLECGTVSGVNPTAALGIGAYNTHTETTGSRTVDVDYVRVWQDDNDGVLALSETSESQAQNNEDLGLSIDQETATTDDISLLKQLLLDTNENIIDYDTQTMATGSAITGLAVIAPQVTTDRLRTNSIAAATGDDINIKLGESGNLNLIDSAGETVFRLDVLGNAEFDGTVKAKSIDAEVINSAGVNQIYRSGEAGLVAGDVVAFDENGNVRRSSASNQKGLVGVVSPGSGLMIGENASDGVPVAAAGRVMVRVSAQNGPIQPGDYLTSSDTPGVAMKATDEGHIIGISSGYFSDPGENTVEMTVMSSLMASNFGGEYEEFQNRISTIEDQITDLQISGVENSSNFDLNNLSVGALNVSLNLFVGGALVVDGDAEFRGSVLFDQLVTFGDSILVNGDLTTRGSTTLGRNAGGYAVVTQGSDRVHVEFSTPYSDPPIVTISLGGGKFAGYSYDNVNSEGFDIILSVPASEQLKFSWHAFRVEDPRISEQ